jgi:hypothetical protein
MAEPNSMDQAVQALSAGDAALAQKLLTQILQANPKDDEAWYWMSACVSDTERKRYCLQKALALQPENKLARQALDGLEEVAAGSEPGQMIETEPESSAEAEPMASEEAEEVVSAGDTSSLLSEIESAPSDEIGSTLSGEMRSTSSTPTPMPDEGQPKPELSASLPEESQARQEPEVPQPEDLQPEPDAAKALPEEDHGGVAAPMARPGKAHKVTARRSRGLSPGQVGCLIALLLMLLVLLVALALLVLQNETFAGLRESVSVYLPWLASATSPVQPEAPVAQLPLATLVLPPTWTPVPSPSHTATSQPPTPNLPSTHPATSPVASITPFFGEWRIVIGRSVKNEPIEVYRFGTGKLERMIIAGIHGGDEANTVALADQIITYLHDHTQVIPQGVTLYILRSLNPDGLAMGQVPDSRLNANGVDLNRNFATGWKAAWKDVGCSSPPGSAGKVPASEPEVQAVMNFLGSRQVQVLINYHSAGLGIFPAGNPADPASVSLAQAIAGVSNYPYPPVNTGCEYTGTLVDWAVANGVTAAVDLELNDKTSTEFETNLKILDLLLKWDAPVPTPTPIFTTPTVISATTTISATATYTLTATSPSITASATETKAP